MEYYWNFQEWVKFEAPVCTWMADQLMKGVCNSNLCDVLAYSKKLIRIHPNLTLVYLGFGLIT
jgi:hypothetical protein